MSKTSDSGARGRSGPIASFCESDVAGRVVITVIVCALVLFVGIAIGAGAVPDGSVSEVRKLYSFPDGGSGSDSIAKGGLYRGAALYDVTLSTKAHLVVLYDNTTSSVAMVPWPDPTSPETGYLYVTPTERDSVLRRIAERESKDERAKAGEDVYGFRYTSGEKTNAAEDTE